MCPLVEEDIQEKNSIDPIRKHSVLEVYNYFRTANAGNPKEDIVKERLELEAKT